MKKYLKLAMIYGCRLGLRILWIFPVKKKRIYLSADKGGGIRCNPYYIYRYLQAKYPGEFEYIWEFGGSYRAKNTICVKPKSLKDIYYQLTSKVLISNDGFGSFLPKRKEQVFINTWHGGGAYKRSGTDFAADQHPADLKINEICGRQTDIFLSGCKRFSDVMTGAKMVPRNRFMECGMPRNDFLIKGTKRDVSEKVRSYFGLDPDVKMVLFAPTYRGEEQEASFDSQLDPKGCVEALEQRFGGRWVMLMRKHHFVKTLQTDGCIDASGYPDMQELLYTVDAFITDYSSTIWDYSLTFKPGFLFVPDLEEYTRERSFYTSPDTWAFPLAVTNEELHQKVLEYDEAKAREKIENHHRFLESCETGNASGLVGDKIAELTKA